jgi:hypothetical protein
MHKRKYKVYLLSTEVQKNVNFLNITVGEDVFKLFQ